MTSSKVSTPRVEAGLRMVEESALAYFGRAASSSVQGLLALPNSLGERCKSSRSTSAPSSSKAAWTSLGREEPRVRGFDPFRRTRGWRCARFAVRIRGFRLFAVRSRLGRSPGVSGNDGGRRDRKIASRFPAPCAPEWKACVRRSEVSCPLP